MGTKNKTPFGTSEGDFYYIPFEWVVGQGRGWKLAVGMGKMDFQEAENHKGLC